MRTIIATAIFTLILSSFCSPLAAQTARPAFLFSLEGKGVPTGTIHVFSVNPSTGAITEVPGSPFNAGLIPDQLVVDPTGRFVYVTNDQSEDITAFSVDASTGALTELPGSPFPIGNQPCPLRPPLTRPADSFMSLRRTSSTAWTRNFYTNTQLTAATGVLTASSSPTTWEGQQGYDFVITFDPIGEITHT